jgi:hypothetical protein
MAAPFAAFALAYLLSVSFTDELSFNFTSVDRLVTYRQDTGFSELLPGALYNGSIIVEWAVPPSALSGIAGQSLAVKVTASVPENSTVFFPAGPSRAKEAIVYLECKIEGGQCANGSTLSAAIPIAATAQPNSPQDSKITLLSEIVPSVPASYAPIAQDAGALFDSLKHLFSQNLSENASALPANVSLSGLGLEGFNLSIGAAGNSALAESGNFLDSLKPEGDSNDPLLFLRENPLISIFALIIVIVITGAYLLNAKD